MCQYNTDLVIFKVFHTQRSGYFQGISYPEIWLFSRYFILRDLVIFKVFYTQRSGYISYPEIWLFSRYFILRDLVIFKVFNTQRSGYFQGILYSEIWLFSRYFIPRDLVIFKVFHTQRSGYFQGILYPESSREVAIHCSLEGNLTIYCLVTHLHMTRCPLQQLSGLMLRHGHGRLLFMRISPV